MKFRLGFEPRILELHTVSDKVPPSRPTSKSVFPLGATIHARMLEGDSIHEDKIFVVDFLA